MGTPATAVQAPGQGFHAALSGYTTKQFMDAIPPAGVTPAVPLRVRVRAEGEAHGRLVVIDAAILAASQLQGLQQQTFEIKLAAAMRELDCFVNRSRKAGAGTAHTSAAINGLGAPVFARVNSAGKVRLTHKSKAVSRLRLTQLIKAGIAATHRSEQGEAS